jgi:hypothetical protein
MTLLSWTTLSLGLFWSSFLITLLTLLIFLYLTNTDILGIMRAEDIIIFKGHDPLQGDFNIFNWLLMVR